MFVLDIETRGDKRLLEVFKNTIKVPGNYKNPEKIQEYMEEALLEAGKDMAVDPDYAEIICVGVKEFGEENKPMIFTLQEFAEWYLKDIKHPNVDGARTQNYKQVMVTFNGTNFDIPLLIKAGIRNEVMLPYQHLVMQLDKWKGTGHIDLATKLSFTYGKFKSLSHYTQIYLGEKKDTEGDDFFRNATDEEIKQHCADDLILTEKLFNKFDVLFL